MSLEGKSVSHYKILSKIGAGGMATVYLADDLKHGRRVAIKVMNSDSGFVVGAERFRREIEIAARLTHPHIIPLYDSGQIEDQPFYVMPFIEGETLRDRISSRKFLSVDDALRFAGEIASALGFAHGQGLIHRDIKPENVLLSNGIALVADFGIARFTDSEDKPAITMANSAIGTPAYMSPEQLERVDSIDGRTDLYSLGCVLYEMLTGNPPFTGPIHTLAHQHISVEPKFVTEKRSEVPRHVADAIMRLLAKSPDQRYATADDFIRAISSSSLEAATIARETVKAKKGAKTNLPGDRTRFIGRDEEMKRAMTILDTSRLLTLTGLGGCGKTRLAIRVAEQLSEKFADGTWFVDLSPLTDSSRVVGTVANVLGLREEGDKDLTSLIYSSVAEKNVLLVIDNCEHVLSACADFVDGLLGASSELHVLATSREALNVQGERVMALPPLSLPDSSDKLDLEMVRATDATRLFVDRAQSVRAGFELTANNFAAVAEICRRLDGIPLAIELAAARVKILSIEQILTKLDDRFKLLSSVGRVMLPRHQTLRAVIEWSYDQLAPEERRLLRALSVFAGGWSLTLASKVISEFDEFALLDLHSQLVDKSILLVTSEESGVQRYGFLETVRQFLLERLNSDGEAQDVRESHFMAMLDLAEQAYSERATQEESWTNMLEVESDNMRVALEFAQSVDAEKYLDLVGALAWFWLVKTRLAEGREHLTAALSLSDVAPARAARARALWGAAQILALQGELSAARAWMDEALNTSRELGDVRETALALEGIGWSHFFRSEDEAACTAFEESLRLQKEGGDQHLIVRAMVGLAQVLVALGRTDEAKPMAHEIIEFSTLHVDKRSEHFGWHYLADCELILGNCKDSLSLYKQSLKLAHAIGDKVEISFEVQGVAMSLAGLDNMDLALRLSGAVKAEWDRLSVDIHVRFWDALLDRYIGAAQRELGRERTEKTWNEGRSIPFEEAVTLALNAFPFQV